MIFAMKKLITIILLVLSLTTIKISAAQERIYYDFTYGDNVYYDLDTGLVKSNERFAVTNRNRVRSDKIWIAGDNYHHIVWWGENNQYIGYHNSSKSSYKTNLFNAFESPYGDIDVIDNDSFVTTSRHNHTIFRNDWVLDNIIPGVTYTMTYDVTLLYKPDPPPSTSVGIARFRLYNSAIPSSISLTDGLSSSQYLDWEVGETVHVENTTKIPGADLSGYSFLFNTAVHEEERPIMRVDNVRLVAGDTIPTGQYFGSVGSIVTPPEGARYFNLQVCKELDNMIDFIEYSQFSDMGDLDIINKNTFKTFSGYRSGLVLENIDESYMPKLFLDFERTYYIRYAVHKLEMDLDNSDDVGIFFWWPKNLSSTDIGLIDGPPDEEWRLATGVSNYDFQSLPINEFALVTGTFVADSEFWRGGQGYGYDYPPDLYVYTSDNGVEMEFSDLYILPADGYDAQIEKIHDDPIEVFERFRATQVYYEREAITPPEDTNLVDKVNAWLDNNNLNNNFFKTLVSIVVIVAVVIGLALLKAPGVAIIFAVVLVFALGVMFGWIPMWLVIPIALLCLGMIFLKLKAGGGGIDESD